MTPKSLELTSVVERLDRLEKSNERLAENRWLKRVGVAAIGLVVMVALLGLAPSGQAEPQKKDAIAVSKSFLIRDENGKTRVAWACSRTNRASSCTTSAKKERLRIDVTKDGPAVHLLDEDGKRRAKLFLDAGSPVLVMADGQEQSRVSVGVRQEETFLGLYDENGDGRLVLQSKGAKASLSLGGPAGKVGVVLGVDRGKPSLGFLDEKGNVLLSQP